MVVTKENLGDAAKMQKEITRIGSSFTDEFDSERKRRYEFYQNYQKKYKKIVDLIEKYDRTIRDKMLSVGSNLNETRELLSDYGISVVDNWKANIVDEEQIPREYMIPDTKKLNKVASAMKEDLEIPGVEPLNLPYIKIS